ncbi:hypothetical protein [Legionella drozanskii]|uniref:hypothetical protein n=1 Tax=Legionella drozanskii TaxID=96228 RepID=UPI0013EF757D|nr:hypothetical protein [Legionella drozanskii]
MEYHQLLLMFMVVPPATYYFDIYGTAMSTAFIMLIKPIATVFIARKKLGLRSLSIL